MGSSEDASRDAEMADDGWGSGDFDAANILANGGRRRNGDDGGGHHAFGAGNTGFYIHADEGDPAAKNALGLSFYAAGQYPMAAGWFEAAARQGHVDAMDWLGNCYLKGQGVTRDKAPSLKWLSEAAAHGHSIAQHRVDALLPG